MQRRLRPRKHSQEKRQSERRNSTRRGREEWEDEPIEYADADADADADAGNDFRASQPKVPKPVHSTALMFVHNSIRQVETLLNVKALLVRERTDGDEASGPQERQEGGAQGDDEAAGDKEQGKGEDAPLSPAARMGELLAKRGKKEVETALREGGGAVWRRRRVAAAHGPLLRSNLNDLISWWERKVDGRLGPHEPDPFQGKVAKGLGLQEPDPFQRKVAKRLAPHECDPFQRKEEEEKAAKEVLFETVLAVVRLLPAFSKVLLGLEGLCDAGCEVCGREDVDLNLVERVVGCYPPCVERRGKGKVTLPSVPRVKGGKEDGARSDGPIGFTGGMAVDLAGATGEEMAGVTSELIQMSSGRVSGGFSSAVSGPAVDMPGAARGTAGPAVDMPEAARGTAGPAVDMPGAARGTAGPAVDMPEAARGTAGPAVDMPEAARGTAGPAVDMPEAARGTAGPAVDMPGAARGTAGPAVDMPEAARGTAGPAEEMAGATGGEAAGATLKSMQKSSGGVSQPAVDMPCTARGLDGRSEWGGTAGGTAGREMAGVVKEEYIEESGDEGRGEEGFT
ncbi:hypothetical protein CLOP_g12939 [Closterium sp. NIES-67]|nr:hypothetical protein CLOP_g12939 [Closterium sp. NIES-67]